MIQEVKYNGYTAQPSDHMSKDGDLSLALGVVPEDGALKPIMPPSVKFNLATNEKVLYIHHTTDTVVYILGVSFAGGTMQKICRAIVNIGNNTLIYDTDTSLLTMKSGEIYQVTSLNNTLIILAADGLHYFLWKAENINYKYLGQKIPECPLSFGLQGEMYRESQNSYWVKDHDGNNRNLMGGFLFETTNKDVYFGYINENNFEITFNEETEVEKGWINDITNSALARINKFIKEKYEEEGLFIFPFFIRYAYRLYDGSLIMHSSPVLMIPTDGATPLISVNLLREKVDKNTYSCRIFTGTVHASCFNLDYRLLEDSIKEQLRDFNDIVKSVDIFISKPIYTFDTNGKFNKIFALGKSPDGIELYDSYSYSLDTKDTTAIYKKRRYFDMALSSGHFDPGIELEPGTSVIDLIDPVLMLPKKDKDVLRKEIEDESLFYLLKSIDVDKLATSERTIINVQNNYLSSLVAREVMSDDYDSHDSLISKYAFSYNQRLQLCNIKKKLFNGFNPQTYFCHLDPMLTNSNGYVRPLLSLEFYVEVETDGRNIIVKSDDIFSGTIVNTGSMLYFYYPNTNARRVIIMNGRSIIGEALLIQHDFLNGAYCFRFFDGIFNNPSSDSVAPTISIDREINIRSKIYTSEVNNPFYFPVSGINTVGMGTVYAICSAAHALSQGQFGQFPLYAFTNEGIWALEVSSTGTYSARQPITREICTNIDSITQVDTAVLFVSDRGIMLLQGSECICISDILNTSKPFAITDIPKSTELIQLYNDKENTTTLLSSDDIEVIPFLDYIRECKMVYDYTNQHIVVYNPNLRYAYVYSFKSKEWGMMRSNFTSNVNSYPEALAMGIDGSGNALYNLSQSNEASETALIVTRPFDFEQPDIHKTIDTIIQCGNFPRDKVQQVLYGSNDLRHWFPVWSSVDSYMRGFRGSPYKAFRLAIIAQLEEHEDIEGFTVQYTPRLNNQLR